MRRPKRKPGKRVPMIELKLKKGTEDTGRCAGIYAEFKDKLNGKKVYSSLELHRVILFDDGKYLIDSWD